MSRGEAVRGAPSFFDRGTGCRPTATIPACDSFFVRLRGRFFVPAYVLVSAVRSAGQARSGATRSHAQRSIASMARIASTGP
jgi:hypothetical protein